MQELKYPVKRWPVNRVNMLDMEDRNDIARY